MIQRQKGCNDIYGREAKVWKYVDTVIDALMEKYNYNYIRTPIIEATELFHRGIGESTDIVTKESYDFLEKGGRKITLRPEGTAGVVRSFIENKMFGNRVDAIKLYYNGTMYRYERPQAGRFREFCQIGAEVFNSNDEMIDAEVISIGYNLLKFYGFDNIVVKLNSLGDAESRKNYTEALKKYFEPYIDDLCEDCKNRFNKNVLRILDCKVDGDSDILKNAPKISEYLTDSSKKRFNKVKELLTLLDIDFEVDESIVRGLDYYDEIVFEYFTLDYNLALGAGGRYNTLVKNLGGPDVPAVGFALGVERIIELLKKDIDENKYAKKIDAFIMSISEEEKLHAIRLAQDLRLNGIMCEVNTNNLSMKSQFKIADNLHASFLVILNNEKLSKGLVTIKDNITKEEIELDESEVLDWLLGNI